MKSEALKKFGFIVEDYSTREELKLLADKINNKDLKVFAYWSRSIIGTDYDLRHPSFVEYKEHFDKGDVTWLPLGKSQVIMDEYLKYDNNKICNCCGQNKNIENKIDEKIKELSSPLNLQDDNYGNELSKAILSSVGLKLLLELKGD